jgi:hypothetical protein
MPITAQSAAVVDVIDIAETKKFFRIVADAALAKRQRWSYSCPAVTPSILLTIW